MVFIIFLLYYPFQIPLNINCDLGWYRYLLWWGDPDPYSSGIWALITMPFSGFGWCAYSLTINIRQWNTKRYSLSYMGAKHIPLCPFYVTLALPYPDDQSLLPLPGWILPSLSKSLARKSLQIQRNSYQNPRSIFFHKLFLNLYGKANGL